MQTNPELQLANEFILSTGSHLFLTGRAGTGKTTFLHNLKKEIPKRMIVTAPTGVAAINAGGVTLHSFFQLPFGPYLPGNEGQHQAEQRRFRRDKINIMKSLDLLVIDEISMVRADLLDAVDAVLRRYRYIQRPFGGVQLLMIGDLHQLPPVVKEDEWSLLKAHYDSCYFFDSQALRRAQMHTIELKTIYRQSDVQFIELLNRVRDNRLDNKTLERLNTRHPPDFKPGDGDDYITLTTHNRNADQLNEQRLQALNSECFTFTASIEGDFPSYSYPTAETLTLKKGAQVMFVRNDNSVEKRYFNGKIGKITRINKAGICVQCPNDDDEIVVDPLTWENIKYTIDAKTKEITEAVIGKFTQYPLRPAWAITVHKSQGLTFEKAVIDVNAAFSHGQVYVALSRCKTFEGMVLSSPISPRSIKTDATVARFVKQAESNPPGQVTLDKAKIEYQQRLMLECFDFQPLASSLGKLTSQLRAQHSLIQCTGIDALERMTPELFKRIVTVAAKFQQQLQSLFKSDGVPEEDAYIQQRVQKASHYFSEQLHAELVGWVTDFNLSSDNREIKKQITKIYQRLQHQLAIKNAALASCASGFSTAAYLSAIAHAELDLSASPAKQSKGTLETFQSEHPLLLQALSAWRTQQAEDEQVNRYQVLHQRVLIQIAEQLPGTLDTLLSIKGIGKHTAKKYGEPLITMVCDYCRDRAIEPMKTTPTPETPKKKRNANNTKLVSYELFLQGKSIEEIAKERGLVTSTIEGHLAHYVAQGELEVTWFLSAEKKAAIKQAIDETGGEHLGPIKERLGDDFSYGEIKLVLASIMSESPGG
jgi:hypothetical protein